MELQGILCELQGFFMENRNLAVTNLLARCYVVTKVYSGL